jgi:hypothetical protein
MDALEFLKQRKRAYQLAFTNQQIAVTLREAYRKTFGSPAGNEVLMDLTKFCRATRSCFDDDARIHAVLEGRREVFLRIQEHLNLTPEQLQALYDRRNILTESTEDEGA